MRPLERLADVRLDDGTRLSLSRRDDEFLILADGRPLMSSRLHGSEEALGRIAGRAASAGAPRILIGGLGMGFTVRAALDVLPPAASVIVTELAAPVVAWNRGPLAHLAGFPLEDPRVELRVEDVRHTVRARGPFDAILLDVDNGPSAFTVASNDALYSAAGLAAARAALRPGGVLAVWTAQDSPAFAARARRAGFAVAVERVRGAPNNRGPRHRIIVAQRTDRDA